VRHEREGPTKSFYNKWTGVDMGIRANKKLCHPEASIRPGPFPDFFSMFGISHKQIGVEILFGGANNGAASSGWTNNFLQG